MSGVHEENDSIGHANGYTSPAQVPCRDKRGSFRGLANGQMILEQHYCSNIFPSQKPSYPYFQIAFFLSILQLSIFILCIIGQPQNSLTQKFIYELLDTHRRTSRCSYMNISLTFSPFSLPCASAHTHS